MSADSADRINALFDQAVELPRAARRKFLDCACDGNDALRREVETLLAAEDQAGQFLAEPTYQAAQAAAVITGAETVGSTIDAYTLVKEIGGGGFGTVFLADQHRPVRRQVALKILKLGMDTQEVIARFEVERQALAVMDHPNIARVFDAGATSSGRPYFVMEYVPGTSLVRYCDAARMKVRERIRLFITICQAVQHAHQKGIIHRDLKPGNVLVSTVDDLPVPKVIDFGIAKAAGAAGSSPDLTVQTGQNQMLGTPTYMSPEQATFTGGGADVDTRSDIYSLGVMLYELLTGTTPFDPKSLQNATYAEVQRVIREVEPPRPSTRLAAQRDTLLDVAVARQSEPGQLKSELSGELDWIVMRCLEKQRSRRYDSAAALAEDLRAVLEGRPVSAAPPSRAYQLRKFVVRHALALGTAGVVVASMAAALTASLVLLQRLRTEQARTVQALQDATVANDTATQINQFLKEMLSSANPESALGRGMTVDALLDEAARKIEGRFAGRPLVEAGIRETIGQTYASLSLVPKAAAQLERAMVLRRESGRYDAPEFLQSRVLYAGEIHQLGRFADAQKEYAAVLKRCLEVLQSPGDDIVPAVDQLSQSINIMNVAPSELAEFFGVAAERRARVLGENHARTLVCREAQAWLTAWNGDLVRGEAIMGQTLSRCRASLGPAEGQTLNVQMKHARLLVALNRDAEGFAQSAAAIPLVDHTFGPDHPAGLRARTELADLYDDAGRFDEALAVKLDCKPIVLRVYGDDSMNMATWHNDMAGLCNKLGDYQQEEFFLREHLRRVVKLTGEENLLSVFSRQHLGRHLARHGREAEAEPMLAAVIEQMGRQVRADLPALLEARVYRARALDALGRTDEAIALARQTYETACASTRREDQPELALLIAYYGPLLAKHRDDVNAEAALRTAIQRLENTNQMNLVPARAVLEALVVVCNRSGRDAEAAQITRRLASLVTVTRPTTQRKIDLHSFRW